MKIQNFSTMAPVLWANNWRGLIPLRPRSKVPAILGWQRFNAGQSEDELNALLALPISLTPLSGVGACAGNNVAFVDIDIRDPEAQQRAVAIVEDLLDITPLHRIGSPPKTVLMYQSDAPGLRRNPRGLAMEIYGGGRPATGQVVLAGIHPETDRPYSYPRHRPSAILVPHLPYVHEDDLDDLVEALAADPLIRDRGMVEERAHTAGGGSPGLLATANRARTAPGGLAAWVRGNQAGGRHYAAMAAVMATIRAGMKPDDEAAEIEHIESAFREAKPEAPTSEWRSIVRWARRHARSHTCRELKRRLGLGVGL